MSELANIVEVKMKNAPLNQTQIFGADEKQHGPLKHILKLNTEEKWKDWHK